MKKKNWENFFMAFKKKKLKAKKKKFIKKTKFDKENH